MSRSVEVRVRLFAVLAEMAGSREVVLALDAPVTGRDVLAALAERYPRMKPLAPSLKLAVNLEYVGWDHPVAPGDEVAVIPPVSGGSGARGDELPFIEVTDRPLSADEYHRKVSAPECGAVAFFLGVVREFTGDRRTIHLSYEAYHEMAEREMRRVAEEIALRWPGARVALGHRTGELEIGEVSVIVAVATPHRAEAFEAARFGIDAIKERVPIWKRETWEGGETWVGIDA